MKPAPLIVGREYQLMNRGGKVREVDEAPQKITGVSSLDADKEPAAVPIRQPKDFIHIRWINLVLLGE